jgi:hypothetical protein
VSADGHPVSGSVAFTLTTPGPGAAPAPAAAPAGSASPAAPPLPTDAADGDGGGAPVWPWIVSAVVLVGGGVVGALGRGRG